MIRIAAGLYAVEPDQRNGGQPLIVYRNSDGWRVKVVNLEHTRGASGESGGLYYDGADLGPFPTAKAAAEAAESVVDPLS